MCAAMCRCDYGNCSCVYNKCSCKACGCDIKLKDMIARRISSMLPDDDCIENRFNGGIYGTCHIELKTHNYNYASINVIPIYEKNEYYNEYICKKYEYIQTNTYM